MDDSVPSPSWTIGPEIRAAVLLEEARRALASGDAEAAVAWAEEVLDECPDEVDALLLVADAAPRYGHAEVGVLAARQAAARGRRPGAVLAAALLAACELEEAEKTARACLEDDPRDARAHAVLGLALEVQGRLDEAAIALGRARALDPGRYPPPLGISDWPRLLGEVRERLPEADRQQLTGFELLLCAVPRLEELRAVSPWASPSTTALLLDGERPTLRVYQRNLCRAVDSWEAAVEELSEAFGHELAVWRAER